MMQRYRQSPNDGPMLADEAGLWVKADDIATPVPGAVSNAMVERAGGYAVDRFGMRLDAPVCTISNTPDADKFDYEDTCREVCVWLAERGLIDPHDNEWPASFAEIMDEHEREIEDAAKRAALSSLAPVEAVATEPVAWQTRMRPTGAKVWGDWHFGKMTADDTDGWEWEERALGVIAPTGDSGALREALAKMEQADEGLSNDYSSTYNDYDKDRLACERIGLQKGIKIARAALSKGEPSK